MQIEIEGQDAIQATEELLTLEGIEGSYETTDEVEKEGTLVTIATIIGIVSGGVTIAQPIYNWFQKNHQSKRIEKAMIIYPDGRRLLLKNATLGQIKAFLED